MAALPTPGGAASVSGDFMGRIDRAVATPAALLVLLAAALVPVSRHVLQRQAAASFDIRYVPESRSLRWLSPGLRLTVANYLWLQTVQYIGDQHLRKGKYDQLYQLADVLTDLDPGHGYAYQTAGLALSSSNHLEQSDAILKKGIERGPNWWSFPFYLAINDFFYRADYESAARWAEQAARTPGATPNMSKLALALKVKSGSPDDAVRFLDEMRRNTTDERTAELLAEQYRLALLQRDFAVLDAAVARFQAARGRDPRNLPELVSGGFLPEIPPEPYGGTYVWRDGAVHSTGNDFRFPPREPPRAYPPPSYAPPSPAPEKP